MALRAQQMLMSFSEYFTTEPFKHKVCFWIQKYMHIELSRCEVYTIWRFKPKELFNTMIELPKQRCFCNQKTFALYYWLMLLLSCFAIYNIVICLYYYDDCRLCFDSWRQRIFFVMTPPYFKQNRCIGLYCNLVLWLTLMVGIIGAKPVILTPWLVTYATILGFELITSLYSFLMGYLCLDWDQLFRLVAPLILLMSTSCLQTVLDYASLTGNRDCVTLLANSIRTCLKYLMWWRK